MPLRARSAVRWLAPLAVLAGHARANVTGSVEVQGQTNVSQVQAGGPTIQSSILMETLSLQYAGMPLGDAVAIATAGGGFSNVRGWVNGTRQFDARVYSFDASVGLLPRRAVPLRLYASGAIPDGAQGVLAFAGAGPSLLYGGTLQSEPGRFLPGLRLDASESRGSRPGHADLSDLQQRLVASGYGSLAGQRVDLAYRNERERRDGAGELSTQAGTLSVSSPFQQTHLVATENRRSFPTLSGVSDDRYATATSVQRWSSRFSTQVGGRLTETSAGPATGTFGDARAAATWIAVQDVQQLTLSAGGDTGFTRTSAPGQQTSGTTNGASGRIGWSRPLGLVSLGLGTGATTNTCDCDAAASGTATQVDANASLGLVPTRGVSAQLDYTLVRADAPLARGGDRLENHARAFGRVPLGSATHLSATLSYDDAVRELVDIVTGSAVPVHERAVGGTVGAATQLGRAGLSSEVRHSRGRVVTEAGSPFVVGSALSIPSVTTVMANATWTPRYAVAVQGQVIGTYTELAGRPDTRSVGASGSISWRLGRFSVSLTYQATRLDVGAASPTLQQSARGVLTRPFEL